MTILHTVGHYAAMNVVVISNNFGGLFYNYVPYMHVVNFIQVLYG